VSLAEHLWKLVDLYEDLAEYDKAIAVLKRFEKLVSDGEIDEDIEWIRLKADNLKHRFPPRQK
jgi:hypothetical protein